MQVIREAFHAGSCAMIGMALLAAPCLPAQYPTAAAPSGVAQTGGTPAVNPDRAVERAVTRLLTSDEAIPVDEIEVVAARGVVTLSGVVPTERVRERVLRLTARAAPGMGVADDLAVLPAAETPEQIAAGEQNPKAHPVTKPGTKAGYRHDDGYIYSTILAKLTVDKEASIREIHVDVEDHVVTLWGQVGSEAVRKAAERLVKDTEGVEGMRDMLTIRAG